MRFFFETLVRHRSLVDERKLAWNMICLRFRFFFIRIFFGPYVHKQDIGGLDDARSYGRHNMVELVA